MNLKWFAAILAFFPAISMAAIKSMPVDYKDGDTSLQGFLVYDDAITDKRPGVVIYPEWWGLNDYPKHRAEMLAKLGYVAFCADMYGKDQATDDPKQAGQWAGAVKKDAQLMRRRAALAVDEIKKSEHVDPDKLAAIGYCFGGTCALELARASNPDLKGVVTFHGGLETTLPAEENAVKAKLLICTGGADPAVPPEQLEAFGKEMTDAHADWQMNIYHDAKHAFTNPKADSYNLPIIAYNKEADQRSWTAMKSFFTELFGPIKKSK